LKFCEGPPEGTLRLLDFFCGRDLPCPSPQPPAPIWIRSFLFVAFLWYVLRNFSPQSLPAFFVCCSSGYICFARLPQNLLFLVPTPPLVLESSCCVLRLYAGGCFLLVRNMRPPPLCERSFKVLFFLSFSNSRTRFLAGVKIGPSVRSPIPFATPACPGIEVDDESCLNVPGELSALVAGPQRP